MDDHTTDGDGDRALWRMQGIHNSTDHGRIIPMAAGAHTGPVAFVLLPLRGLAAVRFVAVFAILPVAPSVQLHRDLIVVAMAVAQPGITAPGAVFGIGCAGEGTAQQTIFLVRVSGDGFGTSARLVLNLEEARFACAAAVGDITIGDRGVVPVGSVVGILGKRGDSFGSQHGLHRFQIIGVLVDRPDEQSS